MANMDKVRTWATSPAQRLFLFLFDEQSFNALRDGSSPHLHSCETRSLFLFAHEVLRQGDEVCFAWTQFGKLSEEVMAVRQVYPRLSVVKAGPIDRVDVIVGAVLEDLAASRQFPDAVVVGLVPVLKMIEEPLSFQGGQPAAWIHALRDCVDYMVTPNGRMKDILIMLCQWLARWDPSDRVFVAAAGFAPEAAAIGTSRELIRRRLGVKEGDILIASAGGMKRTDADTCLAAFIKYAGSRQTRLRLYLPSDNEDNPVTAAIQSMRHNHPALFGKTFAANCPICIGSQALDWHAADIGLDVSKVSFGSWQNHSERYVDCLSKGIPVITTAQNAAAQGVGMSTVTVEGESVSSYLACFETLDANAAAIARMKASAEKERAIFSSVITYGPVIECIKGGSRRDISGLPESVFDSEKEQMVRALRHKVSAALERHLEP
jgi:hypothetical protein